MAMRPDQYLRMAAMYASGYTLRDVAAAFDSDATSVMEWLRKLGDDLPKGRLTSRNGLRVPRSAVRAAARDTKFYERFGLTTAQHHAIRDEYGTDPFVAFIDHRHMAMIRGVAFLMTFVEWWSVWTASGKWDERGRGYGYVMARNGDAGPYAVGNVYICTGVQNLADYRERVAQETV